MLRKIRGMSTVDLDLWDDFKVEHIDQDQTGFEMIRNYQDEQFIKEKFLRRAKRQKYRLLQDFPIDLNQKHLIESDPKIQSQVAKLNHMFVEQKGKTEEGSSKPPIIWIHGMLGSAAHFQKFAEHEKLQELDHPGNYLIDIRNHGKSPAMDRFDIKQQTLDVYQFLNDNNIEGPVTFVCHSFGARIASAFACAFPEKVHAICAIDAPLFNVR